MSAIVLVAEDTAGNQKELKLQYFGHLMQRTDSFAGTGEPGGLPSLGSHRVGHD